MTAADFSAVRAALLVRDVDGFELSVLTGVGRLFYRYGADARIPWASMLVVRRVARRVKAGGAVMSARLAADPTGDSAGAPSATSKGGKDALEPSGSGGGVRGVLRVGGLVTEAHIG